ncbi:hypothetical protein BLOT_005860 [Blomia tropicalis]|nr:hypothetical protein BLOT_005860 [Blomia tropicalis]
MYMSSLRRIVIINAAKNGTIHLNSLILIKSRYDKLKLELLIYRNGRKLTKTQGWPVELVQ